MKPTDDAGIGASLAERLAFEQLLADLSATFANVPGDRVVAEIEGGLGRLNEFLGFDRSTFREFAGNGDRGGARSRLGALNWLFDQIRAGGTVVVRALPEDLPAEAVEEREYVARIGIRSQLSR